MKESMSRRVKWIGVASGLQADKHGNTMRHGLNNPSPLLPRNEYRLHPYHKYCPVYSDAPWTCDFCGDVSEAGTELGWMGDRLICSQCINDEDRRSARNLARIRQRDGYFIPIADAVVALTSSCLKAIDKYPRLKL